MKPQLTNLAMRALRCLLACSIAYSGFAAGAETDIAQEPLSQPASNIPPNIMVLYDDSLSMRMQTTPDYIGRYFDSDSNRHCFDSLDSSTNITGSLINCQQGDPPVMSPDINTQYYSPAIRYLPGMNFDLSEKNSMVCANTGGANQTAVNVGTPPVSYTYCTNGWTSVPTDSVSLSTVNTFRNKAIEMMEQGETTGSTATESLMAFPDRVWCTAQGDTATDTTRCKINSAWSYPDVTNGYGWSSGPSGTGKASTKRVTGAPYYYRLATTEYCDNLALAGTSSDTTARCIAATSPSGAYKFPATVRYCTDSTLTDCQGKFTTAYPYPKYAGNVNPAAVVAPAVAATGRITVQSPQSDGLAGSITQINVNGVNIISTSGTTGTCGTITQSAGFTPAAAATAIADRITTCVSTPDYTATAVGNVVTVTAVTLGPGPNGFTIGLTQGALTQTPATMTFTFSGTSLATGTSTGSSSQVSAAALTNLPGSPSTSNLISSTVSCTLTSTPNCTAALQATRNANMATRFYNAMTLPGSWSKSISGAVITLTAPNGTNFNGVTGTRTTNRTTLTITTASGATTAGDIQATTTAFSGGANATTGIRRENVGDFARTDITAGRYCTDFTRSDCAVQAQPSATRPIAENTFPKVSGRSDCAGTECTYEEEMENFANWFTYYRSRGQMAKTAVGRAFVSIGTQFRVGLVTIQPVASGSTVSSNRYLKVDKFDATHKSDWFDKLYGVTDNAGTGTPNRAGLARVGRYYANKTPNGMDASPITYSCQSNYTLLVTDGYWNGGGGLDLAGNAIGNEDANLVTMPRPMYDGSRATITDTWNTSNTFNTTSGCSSSNQRQRVTVVNYSRVRAFNTSDTSGSPISDVTTSDTPGTTSTTVSCRAVGALPALPTPNPATSAITTNTAFSGGSSGSLADVAAYYYNTDLRSDMVDEVPTVGTDIAAHQHMTTFTVGLGLAGRLNYASNYLTQTSGDFKDLKQGAKDWPVPAADSETALDDLWHAAVNGRGQFFSVKDPNELAQSLTDTLSAVASREGAGAAAATSNLQPVAGDNFAFTAQYQTVEWTGDLTAKTIDLTDGIVSNVSLWSASAQLDQRTSADRNILTFDVGDTTGNRLKSFCWIGVDTSVYTNCTDGSGLTGTELNYFDPTNLSQALGWPSDASGRDVSATKEKLVDYLRGDRGNEISGDSPPSDSDLFRARRHLLGDIVSAQPAYVKGAPFLYSDQHYSAFKAATATRKGTVFAAANDGMLHAFETDPDGSPYFQDEGVATTTLSDDHFIGTLNTNPVTGEGAERWAFIPTMVLPNLYHLADAPYSHQFYVDGSPTVGDICFGHTTTTICDPVGNWHTILVAGLNAGGRGFYALDITDPNNPKGLWELKGGTGQTCLTDTNANNGSASADCNIGYSFGNPIIVKRKKDGKWVVLVTSGYNNVNPGNGRGYLYVIDAQTGVILNRLDTGVGCDVSNTTAPCTGTDDPSGLARINAWVENATDNNTALRVYGGDLHGNLWRFQLDPAGIGGENAVHKIVTLANASAVAQPITTKPELAVVQNFPVVYVTTGKLLGQSDKDTTPAPEQQSVYAIRDDLSNLAIGLRTGDLVRQTLTPLGGSTTQRTTTANAVDFNSDKGWYVDFPDVGERANVDPQLQLGTLVVPTNVPTDSDCSAGGYGWLNFFDYRTGSYVPGTTVASTKITAALVVGINVIELPGGTIRTIVTTADNQQLSQSTPVSATAVTGRRVTWRELLVE